MMVYNYDKNDVNSKPKQMKSDVIVDQYKTKGNNDNPHLGEDEFIIDENVNVVISDKSDIINSQTRGQNRIKLNINEHDQIWIEYVNKFGKQPDNASQLQRFSKSSNGLRNLSFKEARKVFNNHDKKGTLGDLVLLILMVLT